MVAGTLITIKRQFSRIIANTLDGVAVFHEYSGIGV
jgi:hypothetical protein